MRHRLVLERPKSEPRLASNRRNANMDERSNMSEDKAVSTPAGRRRPAHFDAYVLVAFIAFVALAVAAHFVPHFPFDLAITRALQKHSLARFDSLMSALSAI